MAEPTLYELHDSAGTVADQITELVEGVKRHPALDCGHLCRDLENAIGDLLVRLDHAVSVDLRNELPEDGGING